MVYAVFDNTDGYYLTVENSWLSENRCWNAYTPQLNDSVIITGYFKESADVFGKPFNTFEVVSLIKAK
jgi:hypothetical protein